jgi:hypothetical protein
VAGDADRRKRRAGIREIKRFGGPDIAVLIWDAIERRRA